MHNNAALPKYFSLQFLRSLHRKILPFSDTRIQNTNSAVGQGVGIALRNRGGLLPALASNVLAEKMAEGSPFMFPKPRVDERSWWERVSLATIFAS